ncbi:MAG TPA: hypothetical protein V6D17_23325 [Candidatus Obscuribacterales bacterium]
MLKFLLRIVLTAALFCFVFPEVIDGVTFHGEFWPQGIGYALAFAITAFIVNVLIVFGAAAFTVATLGLGLIVVWFARVFLFWLVPAIQLMVFAHYFPSHFQVTGWVPAILAGLLLMVVNILTNEITAKSSSSR